GTERISPEMLNGYPPEYANILTCEKAFKVGSDLIFVVLLDLSVLFQFAKWGKKMYSKDVQQFLCYKVII
uniref:hypothetical protein n=1 Tax=Phocaeicola coprophilus TaxID=387090 RepID=UPI0026589621